MREDCRILVINRALGLEAANSLAEFPVGHPLPLDVPVNIGGPLADSFSRAGYPLEKILTDEQENHGLLR